MRRPFRIPLSYNPIPAAALAAKLESFSGRHHNDLVDDFESKLRTVTGAKYALGLNSGTAAIHLALKAIGVTAGDKVLVSTFTYVASVSPIVYLGAVPVFIDSESEGWNMDPGLLEAAIVSCLREGSKPKAIVAVHTYGMPCRMNLILEIARKYDIPLMEDAAEAIGSTYHGRPVGSMGDIGVLSFNNNKTVTTYGGGAVLTGSEAIANRILFWSTHSRKNLPYYEHDEVGFNYRLGPVNAAMGSVSLDAMPDNVLLRRSTFDTYRTSFAASPSVSWQMETDSSYSNRWISGIVFKNRVEEVRKVLEKRGIETRPLWKPMHLQPLFKDCLAFLNGTSSHLFDQGLCLPSGNHLSEESISEVVNAVHAAL